MATEFSRLYRELCHTGPNTPVYDLQFTKERKQVLQSLGYEIKSAPMKYTVSKHHGKGARRRKHEAHLKAISNNDTNDRKKQLKIRQLTRQTQEVNELTNKIQALIADNKYISQNLWSKYDKIYGQSMEPYEKSHSAPSGTSTRSPMRSSAVMKRTPAVCRGDYSKSKWSKEERDRLNTIYREFRKPLSKSRAAWENYYIEFANIFRVFFSNRTEEEVVEKIKDMYARRQFEEVGEKKYWAKVGATSPVRKQKVVSERHTKTLPPVTSTAKLKSLH